MPSFEPQNPEYAADVEKIFAAQGMMATIRARLVGVEPGRVEIALDPHDAVSQQDDFVHAAATAAILDTACGLAAHTLMPAGARVLTVEYKINLMAPATGDRLVATGEVIRPGRTVTVCRGTAHAHTDGETKPVAEMQSTMMALLSNAG